MDHLSDEILDVGLGSPVSLPEGVELWRVEGGAADVFVETAVFRRLVIIVPDGGLIFGLPGQQGGIFSVTAKAGTRLIPVGEDDIERSHLTACADHWLNGLTHNFNQPDPLDQQDSSETSDTEGLARAGKLVAHVRSFNASVPDLFKTLRDQQDKTTLGRLSEMKDSSASLEKLATLGRSVQIVAGATGRTADIVIQVATSIGIEVDGSRLSDRKEPYSAIPGMLRRAGLRSRQILLRDKWWRDDLGGMIAMQAGSGELFGVLRKKGRYVVYDPNTGQQTPLTADFAAELCGPATLLIPQLDADVGDLKSLVRFIANRVKNDAPIALIAGAGIALLGVLSPIATSIIIDQIIPDNARNLIVEIGIGLVLVGVITTFMGIAQSIAMLRIETLTSVDMQLSVMNRVLSLKPIFFRDSSAGDLSQRMGSLDGVRGAVVGFMMQAVTAVIYFVIYLTLLFSFAPQLALTALALVAIGALATLGVYAFQARNIELMLKLDGRLRSLIFEILDSVAKLRVAAAEDRMIGRWADIFYDEQTAALQVARVSNRFDSFSDAFDIFALLLLFVVAIVLSDSGLSAGSFVAFLSAFGVFESVVLGMCGSITAIRASLPGLERAQGLLKAETENPGEAADPGPVSGRMEISDVRFAYEDTGPAVLNKFNLVVNPGEHVAIVGPSGSGKSSILRLLLGFETPSAGTVSFDGKDISHLDLTRLRQQIGVVMQSGSLFAGSIYENIRGASNVSLEDCEHAVRLAGLVKDLQLFPMGLHTPLTEGAGTISGGQKQRILIARALAGAPPILFMDEATSALDNVTQAAVTKSLDDLNVTRITVAHRLSTVQSADRICVLKGGRFVEQGTYDELMAADGDFAELAKRQLT